MTVLFPIPGLPVIAKIVIEVAYAAYTWHMSITGNKEMSNLAGRHFNLWVIANNDDTYGLIT